MILVLWIVLRTGSRNGFLSLFVMIIISIYTFIGIKFSRRNIIIALIILTPMIIFTLRNLDSITIIRLSSITYSETAGIQGDAGTSVNRIYLWESAIKGFIDKPFTGQGGSDLISRYFNAKTVGIDLVTHNTFFEMALQYGILGIFIYLAINLKIFKIFSKTDLKSWRISETKSRLLIPYVSYLSLLFSSMFVSWIFSSIIWYNITMIFALYILMSKQKNETRPSTA